MVSPNVHTSQSRSDGRDTAKKDRRASNAKHRSAKQPAPTPAPVRDEVLASAGRDRMIREAQLEASHRFAHLSLCRLLDFAQR